MIEEEDDEKFQTTFKFAFEVLDKKTFCRLLKNLNILFMMVKYLTADTFKSLVEEYFEIFKELYEEIDENYKLEGEKLIETVICMGNLDLIKFIYEKFKGTKKFINTHENLLKFTLKNTKDVEIFEFLLNFVANNLNSKEIEEILINRGEIDHSVFCNAVFTDNPEIFKTFFKFYSQKLERKTFLDVLKNLMGGKNILEVAKDLKMYKAVEEATREYLIVLNPAEIQRIIKKITASKAFKQTASLNEIYEKMNEENFQLDREEFRKFLKIENFNKIKLLALDEISYKFMWKILEVTLIDEEFKEFLSSTDGDGNNFIHNAFKSKSKEFLDLTWSNIEKLIKNKK